MIEDIVSPDSESWGSELGIAYHNENGRPVYYTGSETGIEDDQKQ